MTRLKAKFRLLFVMCFIHCLVVSSKEPWNKLPNNTGDYCPARDICIWEHQHEPEYIPARGRSCCTDCSCLDTCGEQGTCCFPELDITNGSHRKYKSCLQPSKPEVPRDIAHRFIHYLMVDSNPDDGCIVDVPEVPDGEQCGDVAVAWWGTEYPAYSKIKNTIYKNVYCAQCHNATDAKQASVNLHECHLNDIVDVISYNKNIIEELTKLRCHFSFGLPGDDVKQEQCYLNVVDTCKPDFISPENFELTQPEIEKACLSGLVSPYINKKAVYSNVFCAVCNDQTFTTKQLCPLQMEGSTRTFNSKFSILLDGRVTSAITDSMTKPGKSYKQVCFLNENQHECRRIYCPKDMVFVNEKCNFMSTRLVDFPYVVTLKLIPDNGVNIDIDYLLDEILKHNKIVGKQSSWSTKWTIFRLYVK